MAARPFTPMYLKLCESLRTNLYGYIYIGASVEIPLHSSEGRMLLVMVKPT